MVASLIGLNAVYFFFISQAHFNVTVDYFLFAAFAVSAYVVNSFSVARFPNGFTVVPHFFLIFPMLAMFDPVSVSIASYLVTLLCYRKNYSWDRRLYGGVQYAIAYYTAGWVMQSLGVNWAGVILSLIVFKIVNFLLVDVWFRYLRNELRSGTELVKEIFMESALFFMAVPFVIAIPVVKSNSLLLSFIIYSLLFPPIFTKFLSMQSVAAYTLKNEKEKLVTNIEKLKRILEVSQMLKANMPLQELMSRVAAIIHEDLGWEYVLVSVVKPDGTVERIASSGIDEKEFQRLKENPHRIEFFKSLMKGEYKISNSYFIPQEADISLPEESTFFGEYDEQNEKDAWQERDLLWIPITDRNGKMVALISPDKPKNGKRPTIEDITTLEIFANQVFIALENSAEFEKIQEKAIRDGQTGLYNHTEFYNKLELIAERKETFCLMMIDIDDFKLVNDTYGHQTGDKIIEYISDTIKRSIRQGDVAARYGGEEFAVILKNIDKRNAKMIAERLRVSVSAGKSPVKVTISIGISCHPEDSSTPNEIISMADRALYVAKMRGKNMVVVAKR